MSENISLLNRISRILMLRGSFINNIGLLNGKLGICIFFYRYSRVTNKKYYSDFAGELLDEIYSEINIDCSRDFKDGLSGICWGVEYIIRNKFVEANADDILEELDAQILERDARRISDISLDTGLNGLAHYVLSRYSSRTETSIITLDYIKDLINSMQKYGGDINLIRSLTDITEGKAPMYSFDLLDNISAKCTWKEENLLINPHLGIYGNGLTAIATQLLITSTNKEI